MRIDYSKAFIKQLKKCPYEVQIAFRKRLGIFLVEQHNPILHNHALMGVLKIIAVSTSPVIGAPCSASLRKGMP